MYPSIRIWLFLFGVATTLSFLEAGQIVLRRPESGFWSDALLESSANWFLWGILSLLIFRVVRWMFALELGEFWHFVLHVPIGMAVTLIYSAIRTLISALLIYLDEPVGEPTIVTVEYLRVLFVDVFLLDQSMSLFSIYIGITAACYAFQYYRPALRAIRLESRLNEAKLEALKMQLQPHFLFNTLNSISVLVHKDPDLAERVLTQLADLLRTTLSRGKQQLISLREEVSFLNQYIAIEEVRFGDRLQYKSEIEDGLWDAQVPAMILQPLVENAIKHGISKRASASQLELRGWREGERILIEVEDDGVGLPEGLKREGVGLSNTRARLEQHYGNQQEFTITNREDSGCVVRLVFPLYRIRTERDEPSPEKSPRAMARKEAP